MSVHYNVVSNLASLPESDDSLTPLDFKKANEKLGLYKILTIILALFVIPLIIVLVLIILEIIPLNNLGHKCQLFKAPEPEYLNWINRTDINNRNVMDNLPSSTLTPTTSPSSITTTTTRSPPKVTNTQITAENTGNTFYSSLCLTDECVDAAGYLSSPMDLSVDPCDDFYQFACGNWPRQYPIPRDNFFWNNFMKIEEINKHNIKNDFKNRIIYEGQPKSVKKLYDIYHSCFDYMSRTENSYHSLRDSIDSIGGWPTVDEQWSDSSYSLEDSIIKSMKLSHFPIISFEVLSDFENSDRNIIMINPLRINVKDFLKLDKAKTEMLKIAEVYDEYSLINKFTILIDVASVGNFLVKIIDALTVRPDADYLVNNFKKITYTVRQLELLLPSINLKYILKSTFPSIDQDTKIMVTDMEYMKNVSSIMSKTSKRTLANYFAYTFLMNFGKYTTIDMLTIFEEEDIDEDKLSEICFIQTEELLPNLLGRLYVDKYFDNQSINEMKKITDSIQHTFSESLNENQWMDNKTKSEAIRKVKNIRQNIAYPKWIVNDDVLDQYYNKIIVLKGDYFSSAMNVIKEKTRHDIQEYEDQIKYNLMNFWPNKGTITVNAFYQFLKNGIYFPAGIAQYPFFLHKRPMAINFGSIGVIIGHEITHSLDNHGRNFNFNGKYQNWWTNETLSKFQEKGKCFVEQYNSYEYPEYNLTVNGSVTLSENIADNGGINQAFRAFKSYQLRREEPFQPLPGRMKNFTEDQLFFISYANVWCSNMSPEALVIKIKKLAHSPVSVRVNASLSNFDSFAKTFKCNANTKMNPKNKCILW